MPAHFLNADLEILSDQDLQPLIDEIGDRAFLLYGGSYTDEHPFRASFEINHDPDTKTPESLILAFCDLIDGLGLRSRALWDSSHERVIDIGYEVLGSQERTQDRLTRDTLRRMVDLQIHLAWTFYPMDEMNGDIATPFPEAT
jgi:hypothetical protein